MHATDQLRMFETHGGDDTGKILVTQRQVAQLFDLSASAVARWPIEPARREGRLVLYDLKQCLRHRLALDGRPDLATERARLASAQADRAVLDNAERAAMLIKLEAAMQVFSTQIIQCKNLLLGMGPKLATELCGAVGLPATSAPDLEEIIAREVREILENLSGQRAAVDLGVHFEAEAERARRVKIGASRRGETVENVPPSRKSRDQAALAVDLLPHFEAEAKKRMACGQGGILLGEKMPQGKDGRAPRARDQAARVVGVSGKSVSDAKAVKEADPERFEKVKRGTLSIKAAGDE